MNTLEKWAQDWSIPDLAMNDLRQRLTLASASGTSSPDSGDVSEAAVQSWVRLEVGRRPDMMLWRNNVGAMQDEASGRVVRFGLANDSAQVNAVMKSADLIGVWRRLITRADVGTHIGQFISCENKHLGWKPPTVLDKRTAAQMQWQTLVQSYGGQAVFYNGEQRGMAFAHLPIGAATNG